MKSLLEDVISSKFGTKNRAELILRLEKLTEAVEDILWMSRRYVNGRRTYAPELFNEAYDVIRKELGKKVDSNIAQDTAGNKYYDITIEHTKEHPYALHGNENSQTNSEVKNKLYYGKPR